MKRLFFTLILFAAVLYGSAQTVPVKAKTFQITYGSQTFSINLNGDSVLVSSTNRVWFNKKFGSDTLLFGDGTFMTTAPKSGGTDTGYVKTTGDTVLGVFRFNGNSRVVIGNTINLKITNIRRDTITLTSDANVFQGACTTKVYTDIMSGIYRVRNDDGVEFRINAYHDCNVEDTIYSSYGLIINSPTTTIDGNLVINGSLAYTQTSVKTPPIYKTTTGTLAKTDRFVLASGDITLTAPAITSADSGLTITVKNIGNPSDLVLFVISGTTADDIDTARMTRWLTRTIVAGNDGKWYTYEKSNRTDYVYDISYSGSFQTIQECISFLDEHMAGPSVIRLGGGSYEIDSTITIDLPYPLTLRGFSYQTTNLIPVAGLENLPMFRCLSDVSFENFQVDATDLASYGDSDGEDFIRFSGSGTYNEVKNFYIKGFWNAIVDSTDAELWIQEGDIEDCNSSGLKLTGAEDSVVMRIVTTDFIGCDKGIWMLKGSKAFIDIDGGCGFRNNDATDSAIVYVPATFTNYINMYISGTTFNNVGVYLSGFDFTRSDSRDANIFVDNNAGVESKNPHAYIGVLDNASTTTCTAADTLYKAVFTNSSSYTCKFTIANNKMTYQPTNRRDVVVTVSGNMSVNANTRNLRVCMLKNGIKTTRYGEMTVRTTTSGQAYPFAMTVYLESLSVGDYFEIFVASPNAGDLITVQDVTWMATSF